MQVHNDIITDDSYFLPEDFGSLSEISDEDIAFVCGGSIDDN